MIVVINLYLLIGITFSEFMSRRVYVNPGMYAYTTTCWPKFLWYYLVSLGLAIPTLIGVGLWIPVIWGISVIVEVFS